MDSQIMNQVEEDLNPDEAITSTFDIVEKPKSEFVRPSYSFKGADLWPFTYGYELLFNQVRDPEDTGLYTWFGFVYLLRKQDPKETTNEHRAWAIGIAWKVSAFRDALVTWMDEHGPFTTEDKIEAKRIYEESMKAAAETSVEIVPDRNRSAEKKTRHQKKPLLSTSSEGN
jgi:hypothetical protein